MIKKELFKDEVVVVTGAGGTLCSVLAIALAKKGARIVLIGRTSEKLQIVADQIASIGGISQIAPCDVTDEETLNQIARQIETEWGPCRYLLNGAGGNNIKAMTTQFVFDSREISEEKPEDMIGFFDLDMKAFGGVLMNNTMGTVVPSRVWGRQMAKSGRGSIVNFASMNSSRPLTRVSAYGMAKAAIVNLTQWLAVYLAPAGIRVNAVAPGFFVNDRSRKYLMTPEGTLSQRGQNVMAHTPMKRFGEATELIGCVEWLLNDDAAGFVTGITVPVDGGFLASPGV